MQFAVLVYEKPGTYEALSAAELEQMTREYLEIAQLPGYIGGAQLQSIETASAVRVEGGETLITDGPFANIKEVFGGFYLFEAESLDPVLEIAARCPAARLGGVVEVRPFVHLHGMEGCWLIEREAAQEDRDDQACSFCCCGVPGCGSARRSRSKRATSTAPAALCSSGVGRAASAGRSGWTAGHGTSSTPGSRSAASFRSARCCA